MHIKITKEEHERLSDKATILKTFVFGSHLFDMVNENSDKDILHIYDHTTVFQSLTLALVDHFPNIHSFQYDDVENNQQIIWMTDKQFWNGIVKGDGIINIDCFMFSNMSTIEELFTYNIIKSYLGVAKRDLKTAHVNTKKHFHAQKSIYIAEELLDKRKPEIHHIKTIPSNLIDIDELKNIESKLRIKLNKMLDDGEILHYHIPRFDDTLLMKMIDANNIREFKYDK